MSGLRQMRVGIVGAGVMAEAVIAGLLADRLPPDQLVASHPRRDRRQALEARYGIRLVARNADALTGAEIVVLAGKPQMLAAVMHEIGPRLKAEQVVLSIVAGATLRTLSNGLGHAAVVRAMPNTPAQIRRGIAVWAASAACTSRGRELARAVLRALGEEKEVADEEFVAMATALSGTGPTYLFAVMEALIDAGVHLGFPRELAHDLVAATLVGSAEFAARSELHPAQLRNAAYRRTQELGTRLEAETGAAGEGGG